MTRHWIFTLGLLCWTSIERLHTLLFAIDLGILIQSPHVQTLLLAGTFVIVVMTYVRVSRPPTKRRRRGNSRQPRGRH